MYVFFICLLFYGKQVIIGDLQIKVLQMVNFNNIDVVLENYYGGDNKGVVNQFFNLLYDVLKLFEDVSEYLR